MSLDALLGNVWNNGSEVELGGGLNFIGLTVAYNPATKRIDITSSGGAGGGHTIQDNGSSLVQRTVLNFVGFTCADVSGKTTITLPSINLASGVTGQLATASYGDDSLTYAKMQPCSAASRVLGRGAASGAGDLQELTCSGGVEINGTTVQRSALTGAISAAAGSNTTAFTSGDFAALNITTTGYVGLATAGNLPTNGNLRFPNGGFASAKTSTAANAVIFQLTGGDTLVFGDSTIPTIVNGSANEARVNNNAIYQLSAGQMRLTVSALTWGVSVTTPGHFQESVTSAAATGATRTDHAQDATGTGATVGGAFVVRPGSGATGGAYVIQTGGGADRIRINDTGMGFFAATPAAKPTVTGSRGGNAALASLLTALATLGLLTDSSS